MIIIIIIIIPPLVALARSLARLQSCFVRFLAFPLASSLISRRPLVALTLFALDFNLNLNL